MNAVDLDGNVKAVADKMGKSLELIDVPRSQGNCVAVTATRHRRSKKAIFQVTLVFKADVSAADANNAVAATNALIAAGLLEVTFEIGGKPVSIAVPKDSVAQLAFVSKSGVVTLQVEQYKIPQAGGALARSSALATLSLAAACVAATLLA